MTALRTALALIPLALAAPAASAADWNGLYLGGTGTIAPGHINDALEDSDALEGGMYGAQLGYRFQAGMLVFGLEADYLWGETAYESDDAAVKIDQIGTIRATLGAPFGPFMPYATGGVAVSQAEAERFAWPDFQDSNTHVGLALGGGVEAALTDSLSVRAEYLNLNLGEATYESGGQRYDLGYQVHAFRAGINLNF